MRALLRQPGKEFTLIPGSDSIWRFRPVAYQKHKVTGLDHPSSHWKITNEFESQPARIRIEALMSVKPYNDPSNVVLTDFTGPDEFIKEGSAAEIRTLLCQGG
jgi:hypothetical protein